jgi:hypothetical protein
MSVQFHEGQEVEVELMFGAWRKAKILTVSRLNEPPQTASVIFPTGRRAVFDTEHIRPIENAEYKA